MTKKGFYIFLLYSVLTLTNLSAQTLFLKAEGTDEVETKIIDSIGYHSTFENYALLSSELLILNSKIQKLGYFDYVQENLIKKNDSTYSVKYNLGNRYSSIKIFHGNSITKNLLSLVSELDNEHYILVDIQNLEETLILLNSEISNEGDPFSTLQLVNIKKESDTILTAELGVINSSKRQVDNVIIKGYDKFPKSYISKFLKIHKGQVFNLKDIKEKTQKLDALLFAQQIKDPEVLFTKDSTLLYIYIEKTKSNIFDGFLGFGTNIETNKIEFDGYLNLNLTNNLNYGESFKLYYKSDENEQKTFDLNAKLPYLFGSPLGVELELNIFKKDTSFVTVSQSAKLGYQLDSRNQVSVGINTTDSNNLLDSNALNIDDYKSNHYILNFTHLKTQIYDVLFPINFFLDISAGFGNRTIDSNNESQKVFNLNTYKIFNLNEKNSIYLKLSGATIISNNYLENELLRFGGINSIRGFEENSLSADLYSVLNTEYRFRLNNSLYVHSVLDAAYFENKLNTAKEKIFGFGFGFGLLTKAGLFRLNYSSGKTKNQPFKFSDSKIHLSLTTTF